MRWFGHPMDRKKKEKKKKRKRSNYPQGRGSSATPMAAKEPPLVFFSFNFLIYIYI
jgi:hypothetical protein